MIVEFFNKISTKGPFLLVVLVVMSLKTMAHVDLELCDSATNIVYNSTYDTLSAPNNLIESKDSSMCSETQMLDSLNFVNINTSNVKQVDPIPFGTVMKQVFGGTGGLLLGAIVGGVGGLIVGLAVGPDPKVDQFIGLGIGAATGSLLLSSYLIQRVGSEVSGIKGNFFLATGGVILGSMVSVFFPPLFLVVPTLVGTVLNNKVR